ncbi:MAG: hypothetical protein KC733_12060 [Candidatus Omnitrophica bacterium]|nr:hypothetical protein [Candidatus Omnitrophota bacterium]
MNWYKIEVDDGTPRGYTYVGASEESFESISNKIMLNEVIRLDDLLYKKDGEVFKWEHWDNTLIPSVYINPKNVVTIMQFKDDPLVISK